MGVQNPERCPFAIVCPVSHLTGCAKPLTPAKFVRPEQHRHVRDRRFWIRLETGRRAPNQLATRAQDHKERMVRPVTDNEQNLSIEVAVNDREAVLVVGGELDPHTAVELGEALDRLLEQDDLERVVLDVAAVGFIDSSGLRAILSANDALDTRGARLTLRSPSDAVRRLLEITDLLSHLDVEG
jgi:anti-anti-sigma factor